MSDLDLHDLYKELVDSLHLPSDEVSNIAATLLDAPEDQFVTRKMRLQAIVTHDNFSREIYDRLFNEFSPETLTEENTTVTHMLIANENATLADIALLSKYAKQSGTGEWFQQVITKTVELSDYHLNLTYNGEYIFQDEKVRTNLTRTLNLLTEFQETEPNL